MNNPIIEEITRRIHEKQRMCYDFKITSITLGIDVFMAMRDETYHSNFYTVSQASPYGAIWAHPIRVCYKRKNLIQINKKRKKRYVWRGINSYATIDYMNNLCVSGGGGKSKMVAYYNELKSLSKKYPVSFLTSRQKDVNIGL